jgi:D-alanyl-D-alanine carboxypeptidase/D-alanyl-D-alanine-endopeptidase (penicillin-binding protein 4)
LALGCVLCLLTLELACAKAPPSLLSTSSTARALNPLDELRQSLLNITRGPGVQRGAWGVVVHSLERDERLFELNPRTLLVPASAAKIVSVATAADAVGWEFRYETTLRAAGPIVDGTLRGDLLVVGSGDPSIGGRAGGDLAAWIDALKAAGIRRIEGRVVGDDDALEEPRPQLAWTWDDLGYTTGALFGALNLGENRTFVTLSPGTAPGAPAVVAVSPQAAYRPLANRVVTGAAGSAALVWPEQRPGEPSLTIAGSLPGGSGPVVLAISVGNPTLWFASVLRRQLVSAGIEVTGEAVDVDDVTPTPERTGTLLYTHRSRALSEIVQPLLKDSINLYGEAALRLNAAPGAFPTNDAALEGLRQRLEAWGIAASDQQLVDGSGLSRRDVITAEALLTVLRRMYVADNASPFMTGLPIAGVDGSLANRMRGTPAEGNVRGKTGTMSNIRSLTGYVSTADGERLAIVVMVNNFEGTGAEAIQAVDGIAVRLAGFRR